MTRRWVGGVAMGIGLLLAGCGDPDLWERYRAERSFWRAHRLLERIQLNPQVTSAATFERATAAFSQIVRRYPAPEYASPERVQVPLRRDLATLSGRAALSLARIEELRARPDSALASYARTQLAYTHVRPVVLEAALARAAILDAAGRRAEATEIYGEIIGRFPLVDPVSGESIVPVMDAPLRVARDHARAGRSGAADSVLRAAERSYLAELETQRGRPPAADLWLRLARARLAARSTTDALEALRHALAEPRVRVDELLLTMASYCVEGGRPDSAFAYTAWVERQFQEPSLTRARVLSARARELTGPPDSALVAWTRVLDGGGETDDAPALARFRRGFIMESLGRWEQARTEYRLLVARDPGHDLALDAARRIVRWHVANGERERARQEARQALGEIDRMIAGHAEDLRTQRAREARADILVAIEDWAPARDALRDLWNRYRDTPAGAGAGLRAAELTETRLRDRGAALELYRELADHAVLEVDRRRAGDQRDRLEREPG